MDRTKPLYNPLEPNLDNADRQRKEKIAVSHLIEMQRNLIRSRSPQKDKQKDSSSKKRKNENSKTIDVSDNSVPLEKLNMD